MNKRIKFILLSLMTAATLSLNIIGSASAVPAEGAYDIQDGVNDSTAPSDATPSVGGSKKCGNTDTNIIGGDLCEGTKDDGTVEGNAIYIILKKIIQSLSVLVGIVAVIMIMISGIMYATASDKDEQITRAKTMITNTIIGIILYLFMTLILNFLVPGGLL